MKILLLDNYDSFTYNLAQMLEHSKMCEFDIIKNDKLNLQKIVDYDKILLSPGAGIPSKAGKMPLLIEKFHKTKPILGVCLGMQGIAEFFGAKIYNLSNVFHGERKKIKIIENNKIFSDLPSNIHVGLYHSWAVSSSKLPDNLTITAISEDDIIMAIKHKDFDIQGVQFHPESYMTEFGQIMIENWLAEK